MNKKQNLEPCQGCRKRDELIEAYEMLFDWRREFKEFAPDVIKLRNKINELKKQIDNDNGKTDH